MKLQFTITQYNNVLAFNSREIAIFEKTKNKKKNNSLFYNNLPQVEEVEAKYVIGYFHYGLAWKHSQQQGQSKQPMKTYFISYCCF